MRAATLAVAATLSMALGMVGFHQYFAASKQAPSSIDPGYLANLAYLSLQLFPLNSGFQSDFIKPGTETPFSLDAARFLAAACTFGAIWAGLAALLRRQLRSYRIRWLKGHVVICGLGRKGCHLAREMRGKGCKVVAIDGGETDPRQPPALGAARARHPELGPEDGPGDPGPAAKDRQAGLPGRRQGSRGRRDRRIGRVIRALPSRNLSMIPR